MIFSDVMKQMSALLDSHPYLEKQKIKKKLKKICENYMAEIRASTILDFPLTPFENNLDLPTPGYNCEIAGPCKMTFRTLCQN